MRRDSRTLGSSSTIRMRRFFISDCHLFAARQRDRYRCGPAGAAHVNVASITLDQCLGEYEPERQGRLVAVCRVVEEFTELPGDGVAPAGKIKGDRAASGPLVDRQFVVFAEIARDRVQQVLKGVTALLGI